MWSGRLFRLLSRLSGRRPVVQASQSGGADASLPALKLLSSMATKEVLEVMASRYAKDSGRQMSPESIGGVDAAKRVRAGAAPDVVVLASNTIDQLIAEGHLLAGSRVDLVRSGMAVAVPSGAARPALGSGEQVRAAILNARSFSYSTGPSGVYLEKLLAGWGILELVKPRIVLAPPGVPVGSLVARGEAELGFQQFSELHNVPGIEVVGALPDDIQLVTIFSAGISARSDRVDEARAALAYLNSAAMNEIKKACGMDPA